MLAEWTATPEVMAAIALAMGSAVTDLATRRIPNALVACGAACGIVLNAASAGYEGAATALTGLAAGLGIFLPFFLLRGMGAGDVKLMGALGACLGAMRILQVAFGAALAGAVLAVVMAAWHGRLGSTLSGSMRLLGSWMRGKARPSEEMTLDNPAALALPYGVAIATGVVWAAVAG